MPMHPLELDPEGLPVTVRVRKTEEKGSDVNLATHLLLDGFWQAASAFAVVSNDSDLAEPMRPLFQDFQRTVGLMVPTKQPSIVLLGTGPQIIRELREGVLGTAQLPAQLQDEYGTISKPKSW